MPNKTRYKLFTIAFLVGFSMSSCSLRVFAEQKTVRLAVSTNQYTVDLLRFMSGAIPIEDATYYFAKIDSNSSDERSLESINEGKIDMLWAINKRHTYSNVEFVPLPILKDLHKYRLLVAQKKNIRRFKNIRSTADLAKFRAGFGPNWPEKQLFDKQKLPVVTTPLYNQLYQMLAQERFDYIPRWSPQAFLEIDREEAIDLAVVPNVWLFHDVEFGFYTHRKNRQLINSTVNRFEQITADQRFDDFFSTHRYTSSAFFFIEQHINSPATTLIRLY